MVILWQDYYGKGNLRKGSTEIRLGKISKLGFFCSSTEKKDYSDVRICGRYKSGWTETEHRPNVENMDERR